MKLRRFGAVLAAASLVVAACGGDDDDTASTDAPSATDATEDTAAPEATEPAATEPTEPTEGTEPAATEPTGTEPAEPAGAMMIQPGECGLNNGEEATGDPIKLGGAADEHPGRRLHVDPEDGRPSTSTASTPTAASTATRSSTRSRTARPTPQCGARSRPSSSRKTRCSPSSATPSSDRVRRQRRLLRRARLPPDHRRRRPGLLPVRPVVGGQHGPVLLEPRWRPGRGACRCHRQARGRLAQPAGHGLQQLVGAGPRQHRRASTTKASSKMCRSPTPPGFAQRLGPGCRRRRRRGAQLHGSDGAAAARGDLEQGLVDSVIWASSTPPNDPSVAARSCCEQLGRQVPHQRRVQRARFGPARQRQDARAARAAGSRLPDLGVLADGLPRRQVRRPRHCCASRVTSTRSSP